MVGTKKETERIIKEIKNQLQNMCCETRGKIKLTGQKNVI